MPSKKINPKPAFDAFDFMLEIYHPVKHIPLKKDFEDKWVDLEEHEKTEDDD